MTNQTSAIGLLAEATLKAAVQIAIQQELNKQENFADILSTALKTTMYDNLDKIMIEWKEATASNLNNAWLSKLMQTQAVGLAQIAIESIS